ncbi:MAG: rhomboid family intramembrane serine protease [Clostridium sp.]|nr:rhomboid family intramembrane serine protease [Clostridium sp.]MCM1399952.1 rhomboid family intramembrane serine protease [Clostridium sp.]MCM1460307.1 rhomboid family intramembrane serine protease [Bacteroides sp.]
MRPFIRQLHNMGYTEAGAVEPGVDVMYVIQNDIPYILCFIDMDMPSYKSRERIDLIDAEVRTLFSRIAYDNVAMLKIISTGDLEWVKENLSDLSYYWVFDTKYRRLLIYENQPLNFLGIKTKIEDYLYGSPNEQQGTEQENLNVVYRVPKKTFGDYLTVTNILICMNVFVFFLTALGGDLQDAEYLRKCGGMYVPDILFDGEVYRLFTNMFIHGGFMHLAYNMFSLYCIGDLLEPVVGKVRYLIIYMGGGLCASLVSFCYYMEFRDNVVSVGASGCVFAVLGAWAVLLIVRSADANANTWGSIIFVVILCVFSGFTEENVDNAAHIGGLIAGALIAFIMHIINKRASSP